MLVDWATVSAAGGASLYFVVAIIVLARRGLRERITCALVLYATASFCWASLLAFWRFGRPILIPQDVLSRAPFYGMLVLSLLFLHLTRSFLRFERVGLGWWVLGGAWMAIVIALDSNTLALPETLWAREEWFIGRQGLTSAVLICGWGIFMAGAAFLVARAYMHTEQPLHRNRIKYWPLTFGFTATGNALIFAGQGVWEVLGSSFCMLGMLVAAYVILTHRLPDVRQTARRFVIYLVSTLLAVLIYLAGFLAIQYVVQNVSGYNSTLVAGAVMALILAVLFHPLLRLIQQLVNRLIAGAGYDPSRALREYSISISNILDLERLATVAVGIISEAMEIRRGALFLVRLDTGGKDGGDRFLLRGVRGMGEDELRPGVLSASSPVAICLRREHCPLTQYDIDLLPRFRNTSPAERVWLNSLGMDVYVPIYAKGEWIGLLALGPKVSGDRYFQEDLILLSTLADQTAVALENARLFDDLKARNAENERLNEELATANRELARLDQAKSDFINVASHELRTPLTQACGYAEILLDMGGEGSLSADMVQRMGAGISKAARRLEEIVDTMFIISRIDTQTLSLDPSDTSLAMVIDAAARSWAPALEERKQTLLVEGVSELPLIIVDGKRLQQALSHLIQNAIKYTPDGGQVRITGRLMGEAMPPQDRSVEIVIADTGIGIASEDLERIFEKFYRVGNVLLHSTGKSKFKGAGPGLGLTIARGIVEAHGGRIWAESPGHDEQKFPGSRFHVILPVQPGYLEGEDSAAFMASLRAATD